MRGEEVGIDGTSNEQVAQLLEEGCYSTNHALAIMYIGELGFLRWKSSGGAEARETAVEWLERYVRVVKICLGQQGWSADKAKGMLAEMSH